MAKLSIYLNFPGTTEEAFNYYKSIFGGEFSMIQRFKDTPDAGKMPAEAQDKIMHIRLQVGDSDIMGTDAVESMGQKVTVGNNFSISINAESKEEVDTYFTGLSAGGKTEMAPADTFWHAYFAMCTDKFGIQWMINYDYPKN